MSTGAIPCAPSPIEKYGFSPGIPSSFAVCATCAGPTSAVSCE
jgi:hypothetical protein